MKWENLNDFKCPCCSAPLANETATLIVCTMCKFEIEKERFDSIKKCRSDKKRPHVPHYWQNLTRGNCVICNEPLKPLSKSGTLLGCSAQKCKFKIGRARVDEILANPTHSANKFNR